jgi:hypothetical protein
VLLDMVLIIRLFAYTCCSTGALRFSHSQSRGRDGLRRSPRRDHKTRSGPAIRTYGFATTILGPVFTLLTSTLLYHRTKIGPPFREENGTMLAAAHLGCPNLSSITKGMIDYALV